MQFILRKLSDADLLDQTKNLAAQERALTTEVLWHLKEVSDRRLYSARGFSSIFEYAVKELHYSEPSAGRRIAAMRLLVELPEVAPAIENGSLNLTSLSTAQSFFRREETEQGKKYTTTEKREVLTAMANKSKLECEKLLATISPESALGPEKTKPLTQTHSELRIVVNEQTLKKIHKVRDLLAHQNPSGSYGKLLELLAEIALDRVDPERKEERIQQRKAKAKPKAKKSQLPTPHQQVAPSTREQFITPPAESAQSQCVTSTTASTPLQSPTPPVESDESQCVISTTASAPLQSPTPPAESDRIQSIPQQTADLPQQFITPLEELEFVTPLEELEFVTPLEELEFVTPLEELEFVTPLEELPPQKKQTGSPSNRHHIRASVRRQVYLRDKGRCTFQDKTTGRICGATYKLEPDHVIPVALGGSSDLGNLQLRCRSHNLWEGIQKLGKETMAPFIKVAP